MASATEIVRCMFYISVQNTALYIEYGKPTSNYRIAGNVRMVQHFALFTDGLATVKIRTVKV